MLRTSTIFACKAKVLSHILQENEFGRVNERAQQEPQEWKNKK